MTSWLLPLLLLFPFAGAVIGAFLPNAKTARMWALGISLLTALAALILAVQFNYHQSFDNITASQRLSKTQESVQFTFGDDRGGGLGLSSVGFNFHLGLDSISLWLVLLTVLLQPL